MSIQPQSSRGHSPMGKNASWQELYLTQILVVVGLAFMVVFEAISLVTASFIASNDWLQKTGGFDAPTLLGVSYLVTAGSLLALFWGLKRESPRSSFQGTSYKVFMGLLLVCAGLALVGGVWVLSVPVINVEVLFIPTFFALVAIAFGIFVSA